MTPVEYLILLLGSFLMLLLFLYMFWKETAARSREKPAETYTVVKCGDGSERRRKYQEGDFVGRPVEDCPGGVVVGIYKEVQQER